MADPFLSELKYLGGSTVDFIEVAVDTGYDVSDLIVTIYRENGSVRRSAELSLLTSTTVNGKDVYVIERGDATDFNGVALSDAVSLSENGTVFSFVSFTDTATAVTATAGPAIGLTSTEIGSTGSAASLETTDGGQTYFEQTTPDPNNVTCLTTGAEIRTKRGLVKDEDLRQGDQVYTLDGVYRPLRRLFSRTISGKELRKNPKLYPVRITAGALGAGLPHHDLVVSRQHRMVVSSPIAQRMFGAVDVLIAAIRLTALDGIFVDDSLPDVTYYHLLFDAHEVIFADGAPTESLFLGGEALSALAPEVVDEIEGIFPKMRLPMGRQSSKLYIPTNVRQVKLMQRHRKNHREVLRTR